MVTTARSIRAQGRSPIGRGVDSGSGQGSGGSVRLTDQFSQLYFRAMSHPTTPTRLPPLVVPLLALGLCVAMLACKVDPLRVALSGRDGWQHPERVIEALAIQSGDVVAEIGAGEGYWLPWLSRAVGPAGRVYAVDVEDGLIEDLRAWVEREGLQNVEVVHGEYHDPRLPDGEIDLAITSLTYHHIEGRPAYFARLRTDLSPRGRVAHLDDREDLPRVIRWLETEGHWSHPVQIREEMTLAGYRRVAQFDFLFTQSFQVFTPEPAGRER